MRKIQPLLTITSLLLLVFNGHAQSKSQPDGTIVEQTACGPYPYATYEQYFETRKRRFAEEVEAARSEGFRVELPKDFAPLLVTKEEFARRKAYTGFECQRIKYMSDGLKVVGFDAIGLLRILDQRLCSHRVAISRQ